MKIYIVGAGGIGGYFGGVLAREGNEVTFIARGQHYQILKGNGLTVKSVAGDFSVKPVKVIERIKEIKDPDLILFTVKTYRTSEVSQELAKVVNKKTTIITFQNGIDNDIEIMKYIKSAQVHPGTAYIISTKTKPGLIEQTGGLRRLVIGDRKNPSNERLKEIYDLLKRAKIDVILSDDITRDLWKKFMFIVAFSGMTAICRCSIGRILEDPVTRSAYERCVKEAISVAKALKVAVDEDAFTTIMKTATNTSPNSKSSLLIDIENEKRNEIETLNGTLVRLAKDKNIEVPINELIYGAIKLLNN